ncbi:CobN/magnesium chelatase [Actinophytocola oryzae]|uniref:CobN/magnesium chelatase n=1 Tax=Actinophytocola oryzae TaxID=502181 RepID=A0A4R7V317_9PSEU|nr:CobN/magnesium chelatase [Actinophytocola oryzae]
MTSLGERPFPTVGRQDLGTFTGPLSRHTPLVRVVDVPDIALPARWTLVTSRGPYHPDDERSLMTGHGVDALVTKDSGGSYTWPKIQVAGELGLPVVVVRRRASPVDVPTVSDPADAAAWVHDWMYERLAREYVLDEKNQDFMRQANPWALRGIVERLHEAAERGLWASPDPDVLAAMQSVYLSLEGDLEDGGTP